MTRVYFNLHKKLFSVQEKTNKGWRVIDHKKDLTIKDAKFKVYESGRQKVLKEKKKNVHAFIEEKICDKIPDKYFWELATKVKYNPYKNETFVNYFNEKVHDADFVTLKLRKKNPMLSHIMILLK